MVIKLLKQNPCDDAISRQMVLEFLKGFEILHNHDELRSNLIYGIMNIPPVTPQQKLERWITKWAECGTAECGTYEYMCSECNCIEYMDLNYCPNCGAKMEVQNENTDSTND